MINPFYDEFIRWAWYAGYVSSTTIWISLEAFVWWLFIHFTCANMWINEI